MTEQRGDPVREPQLQHRLDGTEQLVLLHDFSMVVRHQHHADIVPLVQHVADLSCVMPADPVGLRLALVRNVTRVTGVEDDHLATLGLLERDPLGSSRRPGPRLSAGSKRNATSAELSPSRPVISRNRASETGSRSNTLTRRGRKRNSRTEVGEGLAL